MPQFQRLLFRFLSAIGAIWILGLVFLISADVLARFILSRPIEGVPEIVSLSIVGIVFLQLPEALRSGRFVRSDMLLEKLGATAPRISRTLVAVQMTAGAFLLGTLVYATIPRLIDAWQFNEKVGNYGSLMIPVAPIFLLIVLGAALTALRYALEATMVAFGSADNKVGKADHE